MIKLDRVDPVQIDATTVTVKFWASGMVANTTHSLAIKVDNTEVVTLTSLSSFDQFGEARGQLSASQRTTLLDLTANAVRKTVTFVLREISAGAVIGTSNKTGELITSTENSAPTFASFNITENNAKVTALLGGNSYVQNASDLSVQFTGATAINGASIVSYSLTFGEKVVTSATNPFDYGLVTAEGGGINSTEMIATVTDSRGYTYSKRRTVDLFPYTAPVINEAVLKRVIDDPSTVTLSFNGTSSPILEIGDTPFNKIQSITYKIRRMGGQYGSEVAFPLYETYNPQTVTEPYVQVDTSAFSYPKPTSVQGYTFLSNIDIDYSYELTLKVSDELSDTTMVLTIPRFVPMLAVRKTGVGVNVAEIPSGFIFYVAGDIGMNGYGIMGTVTDSIADDVDLNSLTAQGIYIKYDVAGTTANHYPTATKGVLEVIGLPGGDVLQRFTDTNNIKLYIRHKSTSVWSAWIEK